MHTWKIQGCHVWNYNFMCLEPKSYLLFFNCNPHKVHRWPRRRRRRRSRNWGACTIIWPLLFTPPDFEMATQSIFWVPFLKFRVSLKWVHNPYSKYRFSSLGFHKFCELRARRLVHPPTPPHLFGDVRVPKVLIVSSAPSIDMENISF